MTLKSSPLAEDMPILRQSESQRPVQLKEPASLLPLFVNPRPTCRSNANPLPIKCQSSPIYSQSVRTSRIELRERVLCGPTTLKTPSFSELLSRVTTMSIHGHFCKSNKNPSPICTSMINPLPIHQSNLNRTIQRQLCPIHGQSLTNLQIQCQHLTINQSVNPIPCKSTNNH